MSIILLLLCTLLKEVIGQANDVLPAKIMTQQKFVNEDSDLAVTCSTFGFKKQDNQKVFVYLCKDDRGIMVQKEDQTDTFFTRKVGTSDSGNYSCVYSVFKYSPSNVTKRGYNSIPIVVIANFLPADISVAGPSTVSEGEDIELRCTISETVQVHCESHLVLSHLRKNGDVVQVQAFNVTQMETIFTVKAAVMKDSGNYSCAVLPSKCIRSQDRKLYGNNNVFLQVTEKWVSHEVLYCTVIYLLSLLLLCLIWFLNKQGYSGSCSQGAPPQEASMSEEQQTQTAGASTTVESQNGVPFIMESEAEYGVIEEDSSSSFQDQSIEDDGEGVYNNIDSFVDNF